MDKQWMKDPLRYAMEARLSGKKRFALGAVLTLVFLLAAVKLCAAMEGAAVIALTGAFCAALLTWGAWRKLNDQPVMVLLCAALLAMLAVAAHLALLSIRPGRVSKVLEPMLADMWNYDLLTAMAWEDKAWSGGYLVVMALVSRLESFPQVIALKLFDLVCQTLAALAVLNLAAKRGAKSGAAVMGMLACVLAPTMLLNAGCWGAVRRDVCGSDALGAVPADGRPSGLGKHPLGHGGGNEAAKRVYFPAAARILHAKENLHPPYSRASGGVYRVSGGIPAGWAGAGGGLWALCDAD